MVESLRFSKVKQGKQYSNLDFLSGSVHSFVVNKFSGEEYLFGILCSFKRLTVIISSIQK